MSSCVDDILVEGIVIELTEKLHEAERTNEPTEYIRGLQDALNIVSARY